MKSSFARLWKCRRWLMLATCSVPLLLCAGWALSHRIVATLTFVVIWFIHLAMGVVAVVAATRLWRSRHVPLLRWLWLYINAFLIDVLSAVVLLFVARGVKLTWKFSAVMFVSTLLSDIARMPLLFSLIRGAAEQPAKRGPQTSGETLPEIWYERFDRLEERLTRIEEKLNGR